MNIYDYIFWPGVGRGGVTLLQVFTTLDLTSKPRIKLCYWYFQLTVQLKKTFEEFKSSNLNKNVTADTFVRLTTSPSWGWGTASDRSTMNCPVLPELRSGISRGGPMGSWGRVLSASWSNNRVIMTVNFHTHYFYVNLYTNQMGLQKAPQETWMSTL